MIGLGFLGFPDLRGMVRAGQAAEQAGFESAWVAETRITRDAVSAMTALLLGTERLRVGSAAINVFTRGAALTAISWATMAEAAPGRVVLGIGPGSRRRSPNKATSSETESGGYASLSKRCARYGAARRRSTIAVITSSSTD